MSANAMLEARVRNLEAKTGKTLDAWLAIVRRSKLEKHREVVDFLKTRYGLGHSTAGMIFQTYKGGGAAWEENADALLDQLFSGKHAGLRKTHDALAKAIRALGRDLRVEPRRTYVSLSSRTQFGLIRPGAGRLDLGLTLPGVPAKGRLEAAKSLGSDRITHRIALSSPSDIDAEVLRWIAKARSLRM
jgi:hypothetical protein